MNTRITPGAAGQADEAVLFADVSGSTRLYETLGDEAALRVMRAVIDQSVRRIDQYGGRLIKTIGDEVMCWFPEAAAAARAAIAMQQDIDTDPRAHGSGLRIGLCAGPMQHRDGDVFGDTVNTAARLTALATKGAIVTSRATFECMGTNEFGMRSLGAHRVSGKAQALDCVELLWSDQGLTMGAPAAAPASAQGLHLQWHGTDVWLRAGDSLKVGRQEGCGIRIDDPRVSKAHVIIASSTGNFTVADQSTHGTTLRVDGQPALLLRREKTLLLGQGQIVLGPLDVVDPLRTLRYCVTEVATEVPMRGSPA
ncbi:MAG: adenylate/guanylate cyclase domain-containing protein [Proteobacteria bacterium]|nr:adenylate/guanylate cyclase domain-containing protein [Pseudomonadota bacterium]